MPEAFECVDICVYFQSRATICEYLSKLTDVIVDLGYTFYVNYNRLQRAIDKMKRAEAQRSEAVSCLINRSERDRRAPERLNIASTKSKSYLE